MDLIAKQIKPELVQLIPKSIHGVFWLQTHFPETEWDTLLSNQAAFENNCMTSLMTDARRAGLSVEWDSQVRA